MVYVVACFHQWALSIICNWIGHWRDIRLRPFSVFWHRHMWMIARDELQRVEPIKGMLCIPRPTFVLKDTFIQSLKFLHLDGFVDGRYVDAVRWTLGDNQRSSSKLVVCRAIFWRFKQGTESPTKVSQGRQSDCHAISLSKERDRSRADAATTERISWLFHALAPCGVPFDCLRLALWQNWVEKNVLPQVSLLHSLSVLPVRVNDYGRAENMLWQFDTICMFVNELGSAKLYIRSQKTITMMLPKRWRTELWKM